MSSSILEVSSLGKTVTDATGPLAILHDINFAVAAGESLAIVGASGSGKSTLLGLLAGLDLPTTGSVRLLDQSLFELDEDARARLRGEQVGFVFQSFQLVGHLNALENVMLPLELRGETTEVEARAAEMLARVGLSARLKHYPKTLSGGEQQRVALARAFVTRPAILFADEPTGSLDTATGEAVIELMFDLNRSAGSTLILVTHDRSVAARCGRVLTIEGGRIASDEVLSAEI